MTLLSELKSFKFGTKMTPKDGTFGVEIETETESHTLYPPMTFDQRGIKSEGGMSKEYYIFKDLPEWEGHEDGSLRNFGMEFVFAEPLSYKQTCKAIKSWRKHFKMVPFLKDAPATSVHVHVNFQNEEVVTLANFLTLWFLMENILVEFSGKGRRSNLFALPVRVAETVVWQSAKIIKGLRTGGLPAIHMNHNKYGALNISSLIYFGSLEARCFRGTVDEDEIIDWVSVLNDILEYSRKVSSPPEIIYQAKNSLYDLFLLVFANTKDTILKQLGDADIEALMKRNLFYAGVFSECDEDWGTINKAYSTKNSPKKKSFDELVSGSPYASAAMGNNPVVTDLPIDPAWVVTDYILPAEVPSSDYDDDIYDIED